MNSLKSDLKILKAKAKLIIQKPQTKVVNMRPQNEEIPHVSIYKIQKNVISKQKEYQLKNTNQKQGIQKLKKNPSLNIKNQQSHQKEQLYIQSIQQNDEFQQNICVFQNYNLLKNQGLLISKQQEILQKKYKVRKYFSASQKLTFDNPFVKKARQMFLSKESNSSKKKQTNWQQNSIKNIRQLKRISSEPTFQKNSDQHKQKILQKNKSLKNLNIKISQQILSKKKTNEKRKNKNLPISKHYVQNIASKRLSLQLKNKQFNRKNQHQGLLGLPSKASQNIKKLHRSSSLGNTVILGNYECLQIKNCQNNCQKNKPKQKQYIYPQRSLSYLILSKKLSLQKQILHKRPKVQQKSFNMNNSLNNSKILQNEPLKLDLNRSKLSKDLQKQLKDSFRRDEIRQFQKQLVLTSNVNKSIIKKDKPKLQIKPIHRHNSLINQHNLPNNNSTDKTNTLINKNKNSINRNAIKTNNQTWIHLSTDDQKIAEESREKIILLKIEKQKQNVNYFKKFPLMKNFRLWKMLTLYARYQAYSQTINSLNSIHSYDYYRHIIKIREYIMRTYSQINTFSDECKQIFFIIDQIYLQSRITTQNYQIYIVKKLMQNVFRKVYKSNLMDNIVLQYIQIFRSNNYLSVDDVQKVSKAQLNHQIQQRLTHKFVKHQVNKLINQKDYFINLPKKQQNKLYLYQSFQIRRLKQKKKCLLKKLIYMQEQSKFNFLFRILHQITQKLIDNFNFYKIMFIQNKQNQQIKQDKQNQQNQKNKIINELKQAQQSFKQILKLNFSKILKFPIIEDQKLKFFPFFIKMKFLQNIQIKLEHHQNIQKIKNKQQQQLQSEQSRKKKQTNIKLQSCTSILNIANQIIALFIRSQYSAINYKKSQVHLQKISKDSTFFDNPQKKKFIVPVFLKNLLSQNKLTSQEYQFIAQIFQGVDKYSFFNLIKNSFYKIDQIKNSIVQTIQMNYQELQYIYASLLSMFKSMIDNLKKALIQNNIYDQYIIIIKIQKYFFQFKSYIVVGNFIIDFQQFIDYIKSICQQRKLKLEAQTSVKFQQDYIFLMNKFNKYYNQISMTSDDLNQFVSSYNTYLNFQLQKINLGREQIQLIIQRKKLIYYMMSDNPQKHRQGFMKNKKLQQFDLKVVQVQDLYKKLTIKSVHFEQSISKRLFVNQRLRKSVQKQLQLDIKRLFSTVERSVLQPYKCLQQIMIVRKQLQSLNATVQSLKLVQKLRVTYFLSLSETKLFQSYQSTVLIVECMIELLNYYLKFVVQFQKEINKCFRSFRTKMFSESIFNQRYKIKKANNQLYQFQNFVINAFNLYSQYKQFVDLLKILKLLPDSDLQTIGNGRKTFSFLQRKIYLAKQVRQFKFTQTQLDDIRLKLSKKLLIDRYVQTLQEIQKQMSKGKLILRQKQSDNQVFENLQSQISINTAYLLKLQNFLSVIDNETNSTHITQKALSIKKKLQAILEFLYAIQNMSQEYLKNEKMKKNYQYQRIFSAFNKKISPHLQKTQNENQLQILELWQNLIKSIVDKPISSLIGSQMSIIMGDLNQLKIKINKKNSIIKDILLRKKDQFSVLRLFSDQKILSILNKPQAFFLQFYPFILKAQFLSTMNRSLLFQIQTFYGQIVSIVLKQEQLPTNKTIKVVQRINTIEQNNIIQQGGNKSKHLIIDVKNQSNGTYHHITNSKSKKDTAINEYYDDIQFLTQFHLGIIHKHIQEHLEYFLDQVNEMLNNQCNESVQIQKIMYQHIKEHQQMLSVVYIIEQLRFQQLVKYCKSSYLIKQYILTNPQQKSSSQQPRIYKADIQSEDFSKRQMIQQLQRNIQQQISQVILIFKKQSQVPNFQRQSKLQTQKKSLSTYNQHLFNLLLTTKLQFRNKIRYIKYNELQTQSIDSKNCDFFSILWHFFTYTVEKDQKIYLNCYYQKQKLFYQMVDTKNLQIVQPNTQRVQISLFNNFFHHKYGLAQQTHSILNLTARLLNSTHIIEDSKNLAFQSQVFINNLVKIGLRHPVTFLLKNNRISNFKFIQICNQLFNDFSEIKLIQGIIQDGVAQQQAKSYLVTTKYWGQLHSLTKQPRFRLKSTKSFKYLSEKKQIIYPRIFLIQRLCTINNKSQKYKFRFSKNSLSLADIQSFNILSQKNHMIIPQNRIIEWYKPNIKFILDIHAIKYGVQQLFNQKKNIQFYFIQKVKQFQTKVYNQINYSINYYDLNNIINNIFCQMLNNYNANQINEQKIQKAFTSYLNINFILNQSAYHSEPNYYRLQNKSKKQARFKQAKKKQPRLSYENILTLNKLFTKDLQISQSLMQLYQKFHVDIQSFDNKNIIIYGNQFTGKTQFYKRYFNANKLFTGNLIKRNNIDRYNDQTTYFNFHLVQLKFGLQLYDEQGFRSNYKRLLKFLIQLQRQINSRRSQLEENQFRDQINRKGIVIIQNQNTPLTILQQIVHYRKFVDVLNPTITIENSTIIIETKNLKHMPPSIVFNSQLVYLHQDNIQWLHLLLQSGKKISYIFYHTNNQPTNDEVNKSSKIIKQSIKQANSTQIKLEKPLKSKLQLKTKKQLKSQKQQLKSHNLGQQTQYYNPLQIMSQFFNQFFSHSQYSSFFPQFVLSPKLLLFHILQFFQSLLLKYQLHIKKYFILSQNEKYEFIYKLLVYSVYWTIGWFTQKSIHPKIDQIIKQSLSNNPYYTSTGINKDKQVKFGYLIKFLNDNYQFINAKQLQFQQFTQQDLIVTLNQKQIPIPLKLTNIHQIYIQNYQTRTYAYFLNVLSLSQIPIVVFGKGNTGKKRLINNFLQKKVKNSLSIQLCHPRYSYLNLLQKLTLKSQQQILLCKKQTNQMIILQFQQQNGQLLVQSLPKIRLNQILILFIQDISLQIPKYQCLLKDLRETKTFVYKKTNEEQQYTFNKICFIRSTNMNQFKSQLNSKFLRYYPIHVRFQQQEYMHLQIFNTVFDTLLQDNFTPATKSEINKITKKKLSMVKTLIKFLYIFKKQSSEALISKGIKNNYLTNIDFQDGIKFFKGFQNKKFKYFQDFLQYSKKLLKINFIYRIQNPNQISKLQLKCDQLLQELRFEYDGEYGLKSNIQYPSVNDQKQYQQNLIKKAQYLLNHKTFRLTKLLKLQLNKFKQILQINSCPIIIYNKVSTQNIDSFIEFTCQWFGYDNITTILEESEIIQYFMDREREREIKLINQPQASAYSTDANHTQYLKINNTVNKPSILYIKYQIFQKWKACLSILDYFMFQKDYLQLFIHDEDSQQKDPYQSFKDKPSNQAIRKNYFQANFLNKQTKIVIQYSQLDMRSMKSIRQCNKKLLQNSHIIHLELNNLLQQSNPQMICNQFIKSVNFNGDYNNASNMSKNISYLFFGLRKFYNTLIDQFKLQNFADISSYLFSEETLKNIIKIFIHFYYLRLKSYHNSIALINTSLASVRIILEEYQQKKILYNQYNVQFIKNQQLSQKVQQRKSTIQNQICQFYNSSQFLLKQIYESQLVKQKADFQVAQEKNLALYKKSIHYSGFITRNLLAQIKSLFLNSFQSNKQFFQVISIVILGQFKQADIRKILLDLNLLGKLQKVKFNEISQQLLKIIHQKIIKINQSNQEKQCVSNVCKWIQTNCLYFSQKAILIHRRQQLTILTKQRTQIIQQIQKEGAVKQKQKLIVTLNSQILQYSNRRKQLTLKINQLKSFFVIEKHIQNFIFYEQITHKFKQFYEKQLMLLKVSTLYVAFWGHLISFLTDQNKSEEKSFIDAFISAFIQLIMKKLNFNDYANMKKQVLLQYLFTHVQTVFFIQDEQFKHRFKYDSLKKQIVNIQIQPKSHRVKHWLIPTQIKRKLLLLQYLLKQNHSLVIIDGSNTLLSIFCLSSSNKLDFQLQSNKVSITKLVTKASIKHNKNTKKRKSLKIQFEAYQNSNECYFNSIFQDYMILFVKVPDHQWLLKYKISQQKYKIQKRIQIQIGHFCYKKYLIIPNKKRFAIIFYKQKYKNFNLLTKQFRILSFSSSLQLQEQQILRNDFHQKILPVAYLSYLKLLSKPQDPLLLQLSSLLKLFQQDATAQAKLNQCLHHNEQAFQFRRNHLCELQENHCSIIKAFQNKSLIDLKQSKELITASLRFQLWKKDHLHYQICNKLSKNYYTVISLIYSQFINKIIQIYKVLLKIKNAFSIHNNQSINNNYSKQFDNPDNGYVFFNILKILGEGRKLVEQFKIFEQWKNSVIIDATSCKKKQKNHQLQVSILQGYLLYSISKEYLGQYIITLLYVSIYSLQNAQASKLDIENLLYSFPLLSKLQQSIYLPPQITPQIYISNNISLINSLPTLKLKFQKFFKRLSSRITQQQNINNDEDYLRIDDQNSFNKFIQQFQFQKDYYVNDKSAISQDQAFSKLTLFQQFILQKQLCYQHFEQNLNNARHKFFKDKFLALQQKINQYQKFSRQQICKKYRQQICKKYKDLSDQDQAQDINLLELFFNFNAQQTIWICFTQIAYWHQYINLNIMQKKQYQDNESTNIFALEFYDSKPFSVLQKYTNLSKDLQQLKNYPQLLLIFDFRQSKAKQIILNRDQQIQKNNIAERYMNDYLKFTSLFKRVIIITSQKYHANFHKFQRKIQSFDYQETCPEQENKSEVKQTKLNNQNMDDNPGKGLKSVNSIKQEKKQKQRRQCKAKLTDFRCCSIKQVIIKLTKLSTWKLNMMNVLSTFKQESYKVENSEKNILLNKKQSFQVSLNTLLKIFTQFNSHSLNSFQKSMRIIILLQSTLLYKKILVQSQQIKKQNRNYQQSRIKLKNKQLKQTNNIQIVSYFKFLEKKMAPFNSGKLDLLKRNWNQQQKKIISNLEYIMLLGVDHKVNNNNFIRQQAEKLTIFQSCRLKIPIGFFNILNSKKIQYLPQIDDLIRFFQKSHLRIQIIFNPQKNKMYFDRFGRQNKIIKVNNKPRDSRKRSRQSNISSSNKKSVSKQSVNHKVSSFYVPESLAQLINLTEIESFYLVQNQQNFNKQLLNNQKLILKKLSRAYDNILFLIQIRRRLLAPKDEVFKITNPHNFRNNLSHRLQVNPKQTQLLRIFYEQCQQFYNYLQQLHKIRLAIHIAVKQNKVQLKIEPFKCPYQQTSQLVKRLTIVNLHENRVNQSGFSIFRYQSVIFHAGILNSLFAIRYLHQNLMISYSMKCYRFGKRDTLKQILVYGHKDQQNQKIQTELTYKLNNNNQQYSKYVCSECFLTKYILSYPIMLISFNNQIYQIHAQLSQKVVFKPNRKSQVVQQMGMLMRNSFRNQKSISQSLRTSSQDNDLLIKQNKDHNLLNVVTKNAIDNSLLNVNKSKDKRARKSQIQNLSGLHLKRQAQISYQQKVSINLKISQGEIIRVNVNCKRCLKGLRD